jgi:predicted transposase YdaD
MLLMLVAAVPTRLTPISEDEKMERQREEMRALKEKHGDDAADKLRERLHAL